METASSATKGCSLILMIRKRSSTMPSAATVSRPAVPSIRVRIPPVWGGSSAGAAAASAAKGDDGDIFDLVSAWGFRGRGITARRPKGELGAAP